MNEERKKQLAKIYEQLEDETLDSETRKLLIEKAFLISDEIEKYSQQYSILD